MSTDEYYFTWQTLLDFHWRMVCICLNVDIALIHKASAKQLV